MWGILRQTSFSPFYYLIFGLTASSTRLYMKYNISTSFLSCQKKLSFRKTTIKNDSVERVPRSGEKSAMIWRRLFYATSNYFIKSIQFLIKWLLKNQIIKQCALKFLWIRCRFMKMNRFMDKEMDGWLALR